MLTRPAESSGRPLERHGNVSPREMTVHGASAPGQNPAYRPAHSPLSREGSRHRLERRGRARDARLIGRERQGGGPDDARVVAVHRRHDRRVQVQQRQELVGVLGHAAADDEQVGGEEELDVAVVPLQALRPLLPAELLALHRRIGGVRLGILPVLGALQVPELGVRDQDAVVDHRRADAGAERGEDVRPAASLAAP